LVMLMLAPKGRVRVGGRHEIASQLGWSSLGCGWKVVELWTLSAIELLSANDVGMLPWVPLAHFDGPPETLLEQCRKQIEQRARPDEQANLLAVSQVLAGLKFPRPMVADFFGGERAMIESPVLQEFVAKQ